MVEPPITSGGGESTRFRTVPSSRRASPRAGAIQHHVRDAQLAKHRHRVQGDEQCEGELAHRRGQG